MAAFAGWRIQRRYADIPTGPITRQARSAASAANSRKKTVRAMCAWGIECPMAKESPATEIAPLTAGNGARSLSLEYLKAFKDRHAFGTMPHLALTLLMFTASRIGDVAMLGRANEVKRGVNIWLDWQPETRGCKRVQIPMLPPLLKAIRAQQVFGPTALRTQSGKPFATKRPLEQVLGNGLNRPVLAAFPPTASGKLQ